MKEITQAEYDKIHTDYKSIREDGTYSILESINGEVTSVPVKIISDGDEVPKLLKNPNFNELVILLEGIKQTIVDGTFHEDNDNAHWIEEEVLRTFYGEEWFEWYNSKI